VGDFVKWAVLAVVALVAFQWLRRGVGASASIGPAGTAGTNWGGGIYGPVGYQAYRKVPWYQSIPLNVEYSQDGGLNVGYGYAQY